MIRSVSALSTQSLGELFAISAADLKSIKSRVSECIKARHMVEVISRNLPGFAGAVAAADNWDGIMFPEIKSLCRELDSYTDQAISNFSGFEEKVKALDPDKHKDLPAALKQEAVQIILALKTATGPFSIRFGKLSLQLLNFIDANEALDKNIRKTKLGFKIKEITENLNALAEATGHIRGGWQILNDELENLAEIDADDLNRTSVANLQMGTAIKGWKKLKAECRQFLKNN